MNELNKTHIIKSIDYVKESVNSLQKIMSSIESGGIDRDNLQEKFPDIYSLSIIVSNLNTETSMLAGVCVALEDEYSK